MKKHKKQQTIVQKNNTPMLMAIGIGGIVIVAGLLIVLWQVSAKSGEPPKVVSGTASQDIRMAVSAGAYYPSSFTVPAGKPVKWTVDGTQATGCTTYLISPELGISKKLLKGDNTIEFTAPTKPGVYKFSCSMDMVRGTMVVVGDDGIVPTVAQAQNAAPTGGSCGAGCGCGMAKAQ